MESERTLKKDWEVTPEAFEKLLGWLDPDIEVAAEKYEKVRQKLMKLFKCDFEDLFTVVMVNPVNHHEEKLVREVRSA